MVRIYTDVVHYGVCVSVLQKEFWSWKSEQDSEKEEG